MSYAAVKQIPAQPRTSHVSLFTSSSAQKYEKKQISVCECQDSECTLLKCYLGFGNCGLGGLFGQKERGRGGEREWGTAVKVIENTHNTKGSASTAPSQGYYLLVVHWNGCEIELLWRRVSTTKTNLVAKLPLILCSSGPISDCSYSYTVWVGIRIGPILQQPKNERYFSLLYSKSLLSLKMLCWQQLRI